MQKDATGIEKPTLMRYAKILPEHQDSIYGLFNTRTEAQGYLAAVAKKYRLCNALVGLEKVEPGKSCFGYQVKKCEGACIGLVPLETHNLQLLSALSLYKVQRWPYPGAIAIRDGESMIVVDQWCYLGSAVDHEELFELVNSGSRNFDLDIFKIIKKALRGSHKDQVVQLSAKTLRMTD
ncbi:hypothetical protein [Zwartia sp.]|uniref:hypothetical protein n=1 Tax=Zwartia sp. TaxID=2978004 RepID=UPI00271A5520|nr:hypothetical protein [Zwartia sp.]MDO9024347.1 hypothetical protein [Zwartia sp.]